MKKLTLTLAFLILTVGTAFAQNDSPYSVLEKGGSGGWLNTTRSLNEADFKGKAVLLDFWTYGCINCMQIIPDLENLEKTFGDKLLIIGVHSAKFKGESGSDRILFAAKRFGLKHPVINDSDFSIWNSYGVKAWPTQILLGPDGKEIARWSGEGHRSEIEKEISALNIKAGIADAPIAKNSDKSALSFPARLKIVGDKMIIADSGHNQIVISDLKGNISIRIGSGDKALKDGDYSTASFNAPRGFAAIGDKIYVADTGNHAVREIDMTTKAVSTLAGNGERGKEGNVASPWDIVVLKEGLLAIANAGTHQILAYDIATKKISVLAGSGEENIKDGDALHAALAQPSGLAVSDDALYFLDAESSSLRVLKDGKVKTLIGTGLFDFGLKDGAYPNAQLQHAQGLSIENGKIYIADTYNNAVRVYDLKTGQLSTLGLKSVKLAEPSDVQVVGDDAYIADMDANMIRKVSVTTGKSLSFVAVQK